MSNEDFTIDWRFPLNGGGTDDGFNNASIDTFKGHRVFSLVRETIQNSLDARTDASQPVLVAFTDNDVPLGSFQGVSRLLPWLERASERAALISDSDEHTAKFYRNAIQLVRSGSAVRVFGIHDFRTTGLTGPTSSTAKERPGPWIALLKGSGMSVHKKRDAGGSFGHGSKAPLVISQLRAAFYYTIVNESGGVEQRFQGKSILQSMETPDGLTQGTGYFGEVVGLLPLLNEDIPHWASAIRSEAGGISATGTSIFLPFPQFVSQGPSLWREIRIAVLANFYLAIKHRKLEVVLMGERIDAENVDGLFKEVLATLTKQDTDGATEISASLEASATALLATEGEKGVETLKSIGVISWYLRTGEEITRRHVGIARNGMLITRKAKWLDYFKGVKPFDLMISVDSVEGSSFLRSLENPAHTEFDLDRIDDSREHFEATKKYRQFTREVKELVNTLAAIPLNEEIALSDLNEFFGGISSNVNGVQDEKSHRGLKISNKRTTIIRRGNSSTDESDGTGDGQGARGGKGSKKTLGGNKPEEGGKKDIHAFKRNSKQLRKFRMIRDSKEPRSVKLSFTPISNSPFALQLFRSGESERQPILVRTSLTGEPLTELQFPARKLGEPITLRVFLAEEDFDYAIEAVMHSA